MKKLLKRLSLILAVVMLLSVAGCNPQSPPPEGDGGLGFGNVRNVKNIILLIGDGMGTEHIKAGSLVKEGGLYIEQLPNRVLVETRSNNNETTDSTAAATAIATGVRTNNRYVGVNPDGEELETIVDIASGLGKYTGIITTEELSGGTPMSFSSHSTNRSDKLNMAVTAAQTSNVNLFISTLSAKQRYMQNGYTFIENVDDISESAEDKIICDVSISASAQEGSEFSFDRMITEAIEYLSQNEDGFFLMAEGAHIDHGGEQKNMSYMLSELLAFDLGVKTAVEWARKRDDTIVLVTADHETGGLVLGDNATGENLMDLDQNDNPINYSWTVTGHSSADVYLYFYGMEMDYIDVSSFESRDRIKNIDIFTIMSELIA